MEQPILSVSLKEYKKQIDDLKASLLGLEKTSDEYKKIAEDIKTRQEKLNEVISVGKKETDYASNSMNALKDELKELKQQAGNLDLNSEEFKKLSKRIYEVTDELKKAEAQQNTFSRNVGNYTNSIVNAEGGTASLKKQLKEMQVEMANMLARGVSPTDKAFVELAKNAGALKDAISDASQITREYANDARVFSNVIEGVKGGVAIYGAYTTAMQAFGGESEEVQKSMQKLIGIQTALNSLTEINRILVDNTSIVHRVFTSVLDKLGLSKKADITLTKSKTTAEIADKVATDGITKSTKLWTIATGAQNLAIKALKVSLATLGIGAVMIAIDALISNWDKLTESIRDCCSWLGKVSGLWDMQTSAEKKAEEATKQLQNEYNKLYKDQLKLYSNYLQLQAEWNNTKGLANKTAFVKKYASEMKQLGYEVKTTQQAEKLFSTKGAEDFRKGIELRARLTMYQQKLIKALGEEYDAQVNGWKLAELKAHRTVLQLVEDIRKISAELGSTTGGDSASLKATKENSKKEIDVISETLKKEIQLRKDQLKYVIPLSEEEYKIRKDVIIKTYQLNQRTIQNTIKDKITQKKQLELLEKGMLQEMVDLNLEYSKRLREVQINNYKTLQESLSKENAYYNVAIVKGAKAELLSRVSDYTDLFSEMLKKENEVLYKEQLKILDKLPKEFTENFKKNIVDSLNIVKELISESADGNVLNKDFYTRLLGADSVTEENIKHLNDIITSFTNGAITDMGTYLAFVEGIVNKIEDEDKKLQLIEGKRLINQKKNSLEDNAIKKANYENSIEYLRQKASLEEAELQNLIEVGKLSTESQEEYQERVNNLASELNRTYEQIVWMNDEIYSMIEDGDARDMEASREFYERREREERLHVNNILLIEKQLAEELEGIDENDYEARLEAQKRANKKIEQEAKRHSKALKKLDDQQGIARKANMGDYINVYQSASNSISTVIDSISQMKEDELRDDIERKEKSAEEAEKEFEVYKDFQVAAATMNMLGSLVGIGYSVWNDKSLPSTFAKIAIIASQSVATIASGIMQISQIKNTKFGSSETPKLDDPTAGSGNASTVDFSAVGVNPLLDSNADMANVQNVNVVSDATSGGDNRVYILQQDITDSNKQVEVRQKNTTF